MTTLRLYNTLTKTKEDFVPLDPTNVRMYVCGPTVYDYAHIGNARPVIVFDVLFRLLRHIHGDGHVTYVRNITDIDDKINARAASEGVPIREITEKTARQYNEDVAALGCLPPTIAPRATDNVEEMIAMIARLITAGHAYPAEGHVLFDVSSKPDYGKLARRSLDEMIAGARVDIAPYKKSPMDFVLWKPSDEATPGWESPWGRGRPGWHIECSAMIDATMGGTIDIHGGGIDLVFPHHENEIAQSEGAHRDHPLANVWMHNGFLQVEGEKMSKSLGNFVTIRALLDDAYAGEAMRLNMLKTHYRQPIDWTFTGLNESNDSYFNLLNTADEFDPTDVDNVVLEALSDDLNTPLAIARLYELRAMARRSDYAAGGRLAKTLEFLGLSRQRLVGKMPITFSQGGNWKDVFISILDIFPKNRSVRNSMNSLRKMNNDNLTKETEIVFHASRFVSDNVKIAELIDRADNIEEVNRLIEERLHARKAKDFKESDRIRDELLAQGIVLKDNADGTTDWEVKR